jgi:hypothetical protein
MRVARWATAALGFVATLLGVVFLLWPSVKPKGPPPVRAAALSNPTLDRDISFGQYLDRKALSRAPYRPAELRRAGALVSFDFRIEGYDGKRLPLRWQLVDDGTGDQVAQSRDVAISPEASTDQGTWDVWVPIPAGRGRRFYVQLQLYDDRGAVPIGRLRTPTFASPRVRPRA